MNAHAIPRTVARPYISSDHLWDVIDTGYGRIAVHPLRADDIHFTICWGNHYPANEPTGEHGSSVFNIGRGVQIRAIGNVKPDMEGAWTVTSWSASQYPHGRDTTYAQDQRAREMVGRLIGEWADTHAGDIAQADDIDRNNAARTLEEYIARHEEALSILRTQLEACEEGAAFTRYPDLPTDR